MAQAKVASSMRIDASASEIYGVLADYRNGHPNILPKKYFDRLEVDEGGYGAGTRVRAYTKFMGVERMYDLEVSEPEPGRLLVERDRLTGLVTSFIVEPLGDGASQVTLESVWEPKPGIAGRLDTAITSAVMRRMYADELGILKQYMGDRQRQGT